MTFELDPVLSKDSLWVGDVEGFTCRLINDSRYVWLILVPTQANITEIYRLSEAQQHKLWELCAALGGELMDLFTGDKFNLAALGNLVPQLHIHLIVRKQGDAAWPGPVWGLGSAVPYSDDKSEQIITLLRQELSLFRI